MAGKRFVRRGVSKYFFLPAIAASSLVPIRSEITAGTDVSKHIADISGFTYENTPAETPDMSSTFTSSIPGLDAASDSSFTCYELLDVNTIEALFPKGVSGFIVIMRKGDVPASLSMDIFPVTVRAKSPEHDAGNTPARQMIAFTITSPPVFDQAVPA